MYVRSWPSCFPAQPIPEDALPLTQSCPSPTPTPSQTPTPTPTPTPSPSSASVPCGDLGAVVQNDRPTFIRQVTSGVKGVKDVVEARLCIGSRTGAANVGVTSMKFEVSMDGVSYTTL